MDPKHANEAGTRGPRSRVPTVVLGASLLLLGMAGAWTLWQARPDTSRLTAGVALRARAWPDTSWKNARPGVKYVGDGGCVRCHADIGETYRRHPMGRSMSPIARAPAVGGPRADGTITFMAGTSQFTIERRDGREVHREAQLDQEGRVLAEVAAEVKFALGSGSRGVGYLVEHDGRLFQSPVSWYSLKSLWDLSPGYDEHNFHFDRPIENQCLFCHSNPVRPVALSVNHYEEPIFRLGEAIGCERCHGPGELHVRGQEVIDGQDVTIVNPRHLSPALRAAVCEQCHLLGEQRIGRPGRDEFDYRPGLPPLEFYAVFGRAQEKGIKAVGHVTQMKVSRCFRASDGRLGCISCHDPHQVPRPEEKTAYFRGRCLACHEPAGCKLPDPARLAESPDNDCVQCHMPRARSTEIAHVSTTDHRIPRKPGAPAVELPRPESRFPLVLLNGDASGPNQLVTLDRELGIAMASVVPSMPDTPEARKTKSEVIRLLDTAILEQPGDLIAKRMKAQALMVSGRRAEAMPLIESVLSAAPSYEQALDEYLAYALEHEDIQGARAPSMKAVSVNPWSSLFHERLAYVSLELKDWDGALEEARRALRINPFLRYPRMFVVQCLLHQHKLDLARDEFATLVKLHPTYRDFLIKWFADWRRNYKIE